MKRLRKALVLLLSVILIYSTCIPASFADDPAPAGTDSAVTSAESDPSAAPADDLSDEENDPQPESNPETESPVEPDGSAAANGLCTITYALSGGRTAARSGGPLRAPAAVQAAPDAGESAAFLPGEVITLADAPEKTDRTFAGWQSARTGETYAAGDSYTVEGDDTLTAQWNMPLTLGVTAEPQSGSALDKATNVVAAVSESAQAEVEAAVQNTLGSGHVTAYDVLAADISFVGADGEDLQPQDGESVPVMLTVPADRISSDADYLLVYHILEQDDGTILAEPVQYAPRTQGDQTLTFGATGFSVYTVASVGKKGGDTGSTLLQEGETYELEEEQSQVFFFLDENAADYTYHRYVWSVEGNDDTVRAYSTSIFFNDPSTSSDNSNNYQYPWLSLDALRPGTVTLVVTYYCYNGSNWWRPTGTVASGTVRIPLTIKTKENGLAIENHIPENGTLQPVWRGETTNTPVDHYVWSKQYFHTYNNGDGSPEAHPTATPIDPNALLEDGSINIAIDAGGIAQEKDVDGKDILCIKTYTCTAYDADGNVIGTATHRVEYGEDLLNGSFEYPVIPIGSGYAFANGTRQLFWRTTAPGTGSTLGQDVELGNDTSGNPYLTAGSTANDGTQYAELNAEKIGTLYQDVLTAPGAELSWSLAHRSRKQTGTNIMYLIIAASKDAQYITSQSDISALIKEYQGDGVAITHNGAQFTLWKMEGNEYYWEEHFGTYTVPEGQYATRFFFASATGSTTGNLLDGVHFNEEQRYVIEYYLNGRLLSDLTEISSEELDTTVIPAHTDDARLKNAALSASTINGESFGGVTLRIMARNTQDAAYEGCKNVLRLYYTTGRISVRKVVTIEGWDDLTDEEKAALFGEGNYTADFLLYDGTDTTADPVAAASVTIDLNKYTQKTAVAVFMDSANPTMEFSPRRNHTYTVVEVTDSLEDTDDATAHVYEQEVSYAPNADGTITTDAAGTASCTVTNAYFLVVTELTIRKQGWQAIDENQTFVYHIEGADLLTAGVVDLTVTVHGNGSVTVRNLSTGQYTVTEVTDWSWRYKPEQKTISVDLDQAKTITFTNTRAYEGSNLLWRWLNGCDWAENSWLDGAKREPEQNH